MQKKHDNLRTSFFDLSLFSCFRTELMGFATILILLCHIQSSGIEVSAVVGKLLSYGNLGVEIFFFLSGVGMYYSLSKNNNFFSWYKKRYLRILLPYCIISIPWFVLIDILGKNSFEAFFLDLSTLSYWLYHKGAWFIAALIPLYAITPLLVKYLNSRCGVYLFIVLMIFTISAELIDFEGIWGNIFFVIKRLPCFFCGIYIGQFVKTKYKISYFKGLIIILVFISVIRLLGGWWWPAVFIIMPFMCKVFENISFVTKFFRFMGNISLESYVMNICLLDLYKKNIFIYSESEFIDYFIIVVVGTIAAYLVNKVAHYLSQQIKSIE